MMLQKSLKKESELPSVSALFQWGNFCNFLPPPNIYVFSYKKWTLCDPNLFVLEI